MSAEINWGVRLRHRSDALRMLAEVAQQLSDRLAGANVVAAQLTLKLKIALPGWVEPIKKGGHGACEDMSRSVALAQQSRDAQALLRCGTQLFDALAPTPSAIRGVGLAARLAEPLNVADTSLRKWLRA